MNKKLSKEEILKKHYDVLTSSKDGNWASWDKVLEYGDAEISFLAMQEYADQEKKKEAIALETYLKKINPDKDSTEIYQHGFHDAIEVVLDYLSNNQQK